jgi:transposase
MKPISMDKREIIVAARKRGENPETIALWVNVSVSSVYNICRMAKENTLAPKPFPGRKSILTSNQLTKIKEAIEEKNDITLEELIENLELPIKKSRLSQVIINMGFSFKKRHCTQKNKCVKMLS